MPDTPTRLYADVTDTEVAEIATSWPYECPLRRHVDAELMNRGYAWDPDLSDDDNRAQFQAVADRVHAEARRQMDAAKGQ